MTVAVETAYSNYFQICSEPISDEACIAKSADRLTDFESSGMGKYEQ